MPKKNGNISDSEVLSSDLMGYLDLLQERVIVTDIKGNFIFLNKQAKIDFGDDALKINPLNWSTTYQIRDAESLEPVANSDLPIMKVLSSGKETSRDMCVTGKEGDSYVRIHARPRLSPEGKLIGCIATYNDITLEVTQKRRIAQNEYQLSTLLERINEGVMHVDLTGKVLFVNNKFCSMVGYSRQELLGQNIIKAVKLDPEAAAKANQRLLDNVRGKKERYELNITTGNGEKRIFEISGAPMMDNQGVITGIISLHTDITERRQANNLLRASEAQYRSLVEHMKEGLVLLDKQGAITFANEQFCKLTGYGKQFLIGNQYSSIFDIGKLPNKNTEKVLQITDSNGQKRWHKISIVKYKTDKDKPTGLMLMHSDITDEKLFAEERERLLVTSEHTSDFVAMINIKGVVLYANHACRKAAGIPMKLPAEKIEMERYYTPESLDKLYNIAVPSSIKNGTWQGEMNVITKAGAIIPISQVIICKRDEHGKVDYFTSIGRDISSIKQYQREMAILARMPHEQPSPLMRFARNGTITYANPASKILLEKWNTKIQGKVPLHWQHTITQALRTGQQEQHEINFDGRVLEAKIVPVPEYEYVNLITNDITHRKQAEEKLKASERKYRAVVEDQTELISRYLPDGTITFANRAYCRYFGYESDSIVGNNLFKLIPKPKLKEFKSKLASLSYQNQSITYSQEIKEKGKESRWQMWTDRALYDDDNNFIEYQSVALDITTLKKTEQELRMQEIYLRQIIDSIPNLVFVRDQEGRYRLINKAFADLLGTEIKKVVGQKHELAAKKFPLDKVYLEQDQYVINSKKEVYYPEETITRPVDNKQYWFSTIKKPLQSPDGSWQILGVSTDITHRKKLEQSLQLQLQLRSLISNIATRFINLPFHQIDHAISTSLKNLGEINDIDRAVINVKVNDGFKPLYYWLSEETEVNNPPPQSASVFTKGTKEYKQLTTKGYVYYSINDSSKPEDAFFKKFVERTSIKSAIVFPLESKGETFGYITLSSIRKPAIWDDDIISLLRITAQVISSALERKNTEALLNFTLQFENIITIISANFISIAHKDINGEINNSLKYVSEFLGIDQGYVFMANGTGRRFRLSHYWIEGGQNPNPAMVTMVEDHKYVWVYRQIKKNGYFTYSSISPMPDEAHELQPIINASGIKSCIGIPIMSNGVFRGLLVFASFRKERFWQNEAIPLLRILSQILANALDRKRNEEEIAETRELYRTLARNIPKSAVFLYDHDLRYRLVEGAELEGQGYDKESMEGKKLNQILPPSTYRELEPLYQNALLGKEHIMEREFNKKHYLIHFLPVRNERKEIYAGMVMSLDISDLKETQRKLELHTAELVRSNEDLELFAYAASHDLQEPLRMVSSYMHLIERRLGNKLEADTKEFMSYAVDGVKRMQELINDLLEYSRVDRKGHNFRLLDMTKTVEFVKINLQQAINEAQATITMDELPEIMADQPQLISLLQNLLENAIKFRGDRLPVIHIGYQNGEDEHTFYIKDNGIGIQKKYFQKVFHIFQRLHSRNEYDGSGIGLAICKKIVERHGGNLHIESEEGQGTTFYFTISKKLVE